MGELGFSPEARFIHGNPIESISFGVVHDVHVRNCPSSIHSEKRRAMEEKASIQSKNQ